MKNLIIAMCLTLFLSIGVQGEPNNVSFPKGITASLMFADSADIDTNPNNIFGRVGYQYGVLEGFIGAEVQEFDIWELGFKLFSRNAVDANSIPVVSDILGSYLNQKSMEVRGYTGAHWVENRILKTNYTGAILGIEQKEKDSPLSIYAEAQYNNTDRNRLSGFMGLKFNF